MNIRRAWAMPNKWTFKIKPIDELLNKYIQLQGANWADPFCGHSLRAQFRNDLDEKNAFTCSHKDALEFVTALPAELEGALFDPPYSPGQMARAYKNAGRKVGMKETQNATFYSKIRNELAPKIKIGGIVISFGWNSTGMGKKRGFEPIEMLIINHGSAINDTLVLVERKNDE